ncbi:MAG TPA: rRNA maturation RNase YbeY [Candidatus Merdiplasma excrementigallinarum]|uniref:Endoribonuclease YbeY n=1 Tax=Candidatus Merdiplasma excrementigallinarum TaxID=2840864 RepID=A0A9D1NXG9_9FIRM|nr:rRNA maturation RNase YbeY [Candidatus Merdiplasma excrementigallinarum]
MTLEFENESGTELGLPLEETARMVIEAALDELKCPYEAEVSLLITDNARIQEMNRQFRQIDRPTDVLSFPMIQFDQPGDFSFLEEEEPEECFNPETGELVLGDIVISAEKVLEQAEEYGHSVKREYAFLIVHSVLHLTGYDHMVPEEAEWMEQRQRQILEQLHITR